MISMLSGACRMPHGPHHSEGPYNRLNTQSRSRYRRSSLGFEFPVSAGHEIRNETRRRISNCTLQQISEGKAKSNLPYALDQLFCN